MMAPESYEVQICSPHKCILRNEQAGWKKGFHSLAEAVRFIQQLPGGLWAALNVLDAQRHHLMRLNSLSFAIRPDADGPSPDNRTDPSELWRNPRRNP